MFADLAAVVEFVYKGEVNVTQSQLASFLKTAEMLQVRGLAGDDDAPSPQSAQTGTQQQQLKQASVGRITQTLTIALQGELLLHVYCLCMRGVIRPTADLTLYRLRLR